MSELEDFHEKQRRLFSALNDQPVQSIIGLVDSSGRSLGRVALDPAWYLRVRLIAWRTEEQTNLERRLLTVHLKGERDYLSQYAENVHADTVVSFSAKIMLNEETNSMEGVFIGPIACYESDTQLNTLREELQTPIIHKSKVFGKMVYDRSLGWFSGRIRASSRRVDFFVEIDDPSAIGKELPSIEKTVGDVDALIETMKTFATKELLQTKNDFWLSERAKPVTPDDFRQRLKVDGIVLKLDRTIQVSFRAGQLFYGHDIHVCATEDRTPTSADIVG